MNWILIAVLIILIGNALIGLKAGFIKTAFSLVSFIVALILTIIISPKVNTFLKNNEKFSGKITQKIEKVLELEEKEKGATDKKTLVDGLLLPKSIKKNLMEKQTEASDNVKSYIAEYVTGIIINAIAFFITFIIIFIILWIISLALNILSKLPLINQINKTAGLIAGALQGLFVVWLFFILLMIFAGSKLGQSVLLMINKDAFLSILYNNNLLLVFFTRAAKIFL